MHGTPPKTKCRKRGHPSGWIRQEKRYRIYKRDKYVCVYCLRWLQPKHLTIDHVKPRKNGGKHHHSNLVTACRRCNSSLQDKTLREWCVLTDKDIKAIRRRIRNAVRRKLPRD